MSRRAEETIPLPARLHPLADACGWQRYARSMALARETWVPRVGEHVMQGDLRVPRGRGDLAALVAAAPAAARDRAARESGFAEAAEAQAAALLARAAEHRAKAARIRAALDALAADTSTAKGTSP